MRAIAMGLAPFFVVLGCGSGSGAPPVAPAETTPIAVAAPPPTPAKNDLSACPPVVVTKLETVDLSSSDESMLFSWILDRSSNECAIAALPVVADRLGPKSDAMVVDDFCSNAATFARFLRPETVARIEAAYRRFTYRDDRALVYFLGLLHNRIDLRDHLQGRVSRSWTFAGPRDEGAAAWHYAMYLASLGDKRALAALADKIANTASGQNATLLLDSLSDLYADGVTEILRRYEKDTRRADGTDGPGMMISENVKFWLMKRTMMQNAGVR